MLIGARAASVTTSSLVSLALKGVKPSVTVKPAIPTTSVASVNVGGSLVITVGTGNDTITEESLLVGATDSIFMGSGTDTVTIGAPTETRPEA